MKNWYNEVRGKTEEVFIKTSKQEWMFWDSAYRQEACRI